MVVKRKAKIKPRKKTKRISGRGIEKQIYDGIRKAYPRWWIYRFNENRFHATPADIIIETPKYDILLEVKASGSDTIYLYNIRESQRKSLQDYHNKYKRNLSIVALYYASSKKFILIDIITILSLGSISLKYKEAKKIGFEVDSWKEVNKSFGKTHRGKLRISSRS